MKKNSITSKSYEEKRREENFSFEEKFEDQLDQFFYHTLLCFNVEIFFEVMKNNYFKNIYLEVAHLKIFL